MGYYMSVCCCSERVPFSWTLFSFSNCWVHLSRLSISAGSALPLPRHLTRPWPSIRYTYLRQGVTNKLSIQSIISRAHYNIPSYKFRKVLFYSYDWRWFVGMSLHPIMSNIVDDPGQETYQSCKNWLRMRFQCHPAARKYPERGPKFSI